MEIASRGKSKSYSFGSKLVKNFVVGENETARSKVKSLITAYQKEYLINQIGSNLSYHSFLHI